MKKLFALFAIGLLSACASATPERRVIDSAADALGGAERLSAVKALMFEAHGTAPNAGQNRTPDDPEPVWNLTAYARAMDPAHERMVVRQEREAQFLFAGDLRQRNMQGVEGDLAFNIDDNGRLTRAGDAVARDRRVEMLHYPVTAIRAALDPDSHLANARTEGKEQLVDITTKRGDTVTLAVDATTHLPTRVISKADNANLGDVSIVTTFENYEDVSGVKLPRHLTTKMDKYVQLDLNVTINRMDQAVPNLDAPPAVKSQPVPTPPPVVVTAEPVAKGIWWLAGSGNHRSVVFEFADHLVLYEVPLNEARSKAVIDKARTLSTKPLTIAIVSHHHFDHSGGLRTAVAEGLTIVTYRGNEALFKQLLARPHTIAPDELQKNPREAKFEFVDDSMTLKDDAMEVRLYHLLDNPREGTNLFAYVPRERMLVQADLYDSTWLRHSWGQNVLSNIAQRKLAVDRDVPVHGAIEPFSQMVATIKAKPGTVTSTN